MVIDACAAVVYVQYGCYPTIVEICGRLIADLGLLESERPGWISGSVPIFMMQAADVREGDDSTLVR
jgi:hypothetical protein